MAITRKQGHQIHFLDRYLQPSDFIHERFLQLHEIDMVGIHINTVCSRDSFQMIADLDRQRKNGNWHGKIIVGGPHVSVLPETIPDCVDHLVLGEGETSLANILDGKATERILHSKKLTELDPLPFQPWDIFTRLPYNDYCPWMSERPVFTMNTSRGCPYNCHFCSVGSIWGRNYSFFSAPRIVEEINYLVTHHNARGIYFREDNFTLNEKRTNDFCELLLQKNIKISWACETRVDNLSRELVTLMARAGCRAFYLGIESGSQRILDCLNKGITIKQIVDAITWSKDAGINTYCSLIAGIPGETSKDLRQTIRLMKCLQPYQYSFNIFVGLPDSPLYQEIKKIHKYEYEDSIGLLYLPGFDIKTKYFYGIDSKEMVDYQFRKRASIWKKLCRRAQNLSRRLIETARAKE
jgi:O-antigen biosynthesis protein